MKNYTEEELDTKFRECMVLLYTLPRSEQRDHIEILMGQAHHWVTRDKQELALLKTAMDQAGEVLKSRAPHLLRPGLVQMFEVLLNELEGKQQPVTVPAVLIETRGLIQKRAAPLLDGLTLKQWKHMSMLRACTTVGGRVSKKEQVRILNDAVAVLCELGIASRGKANNPDWCPVAAPWGDYWWLYTVEMIQELLWLMPEFLQGYNYSSAIVHGEPSIGRYRDANPYIEPSRHASWDHGYIFGRTKPEKLQAWLELLRR